MFGIIKKVFGTKSERDRKKFEPIVAQINEEYEKLRELSNDELRNQTLQFREIIKNHLSDIEDQINDNKAQAIDTEDIAAKEQLFKQVDELVKERDQLLESTFRYQT